jgi:hypothetical protein
MLATGAHHGGVRGASVLAPWAIGRTKGCRSVHAHVTKAFGDRLGETRAAMEALAASLPPEELMLDQSAPCSSGIAQSALRNRATSALTGARRGRRRIGRVDGSNRRCESWLQGRIDRPPAFERLKPISFTGEAVGRKVVL